MAKKGQTTGIPKAKPRSGDIAETPKARAQREYRSRAEREAQIQRWLTLGTAVAIALIVLVVAVALILDQIIIPNQTVATVNGQNISIREFQDRVRLERVLNNDRLNAIINAFIDPSLPSDQVQGQIGQLLSIEPYRTWYNEATVPDQMGLRVLEDMIDDQIVRARAADLGITVTEADIQQEIDGFFGFSSDEAAKLEATPEATAEVTPTVEPSPTPTPYVSPTPSPTPTITPTVELTPTTTPTPFPTVPPTPTLTASELTARYQENVDAFYRQLRLDTGLGEDAFRAYIELQALRKKVRDAVTPEITKLTPFVNTRHILVDTEEEARDILAALNEGESFADLARAASKDSSSATRGGELGWSPILGFVKPFGDAVREATVGEIIGPVQTEFGYHIIQVRAREDREVDDSQLESFKERAFKDWLEQQRQSETVQSETFAIWVNYVPDSPAFQLTPR